MGSVKAALVSAGAAAMLATAACGGDNGEGSGNGGGGNGMGAGDPAASSVVLGGADLEVHVVRCVGTPGEGSLRVHADIGDPDDNVLMAVDEQPDGARVRITRGQGDADFSGHSWYSPSDRIGDAEIDADGARGDLELRWDTNSGQDEPDEGGPIPITFDLVCS